MDIHIKHPKQENILHFIEQKLRKTEDPSASIALTIHEINNKKICNTWYCEYEEWKKINTEKIFLKQPNKDELGEILQNTIKTLINKHKKDQEIRLKLAIIGLQNLIEFKILRNTI